MKSNLKYEKIKQDFYQQIQNRELLPNEKLASEAEYAEHYNVSTITIRKALSDLASEGYIRRIKGKGSFVESPSKFSGSSRLIALVIASEYYQDASSFAQDCRKASVSLSSSFSSLCRSSKPSKLNLPIFPMSCPPFKQLQDDLLMRWIDRRDAAALIVRRNAVLRHRHFRPRPDRDLRCQK